MSAKPLYFFTVANHGYVDMVKNTAESMRRAGIRQPLHVYCFDSNTFDALSALNLANQIVPHAFLIPLSHDLTNYATAEYKKIIYKKFDVICYLLENIEQTEADVFFYLDSDVVMLKDPTAEVRKLLSSPSPVDLLFQKGGQPSDPEYGMRCTGVIAFRNTAGLLPLFTVEKADAHLVYDYSDGDQGYLNDRIKTYKCTERILPPMLFPNGSYRKNKLFDRKVAYLLHYNWMQSYEKIPSMQADHLWFVGPVASKAIQIPSRFQRSHQPIPIPSIRPRPVVAKQTGPTLPISNLRSQFM